jgi:pyrimidine deaminase RibD-like protein
MTNKAANMNTRVISFLFLISLRHTATSFLTHSQRHHHAHDLIGRRTQDRTDPRGFSYGKSISSYRILAELQDTNDEDSRTNGEISTMAIGGDTRVLEDDTNASISLPSPSISERNDGETKNALDLFTKTEEEDSSAIDNVELERLRLDEKYMDLAIDYAQRLGGERGPDSAYPNPTMGAVLIADDGRILGQGRSSYDTTAVRDVLEDAGLEITALREWCITWPSSAVLRHDLSTATLYLTLEPSNRRRGQTTPPLTQLIELSGVPRVVIGCPSPIPEESTQGAKTLHQAGLDVDVGVLPDECRGLIQLYEERANSKLQRMARKHSKMFGRPLGFLHCSVVDSVDLEAFAQHGNAFGKSFGGKTLSFRDFGSYEIAPPPESIWARDDDDDSNGLEPDGLDVGYIDVEMDDDEEVSEMYSLDFEEENKQERMDGSPVMPWYVLFCDTCQTITFWTRSLSHNFPVNIFALGTSKLTVS